VIPVAQRLNKGVLDQILGILRIFRESDGKPLQKLPLTDKQLIELVRTHGKAIVCLTFRGKD
jgi:hypothetical protein